MNRILKKDNHIETTNSRKFVDVRNRIIHGHDSVSDEIIWGIIVRNPPILQAEVKSFLSE
jgi:uncharacterized protein with HEPN domain